MHTCTHTHTQNQTPAALALDLHMTVTLLLSATRSSSNAGGEQYQPCAQQQWEPKDNTATLTGKAEGRRVIPSRRPRAKPTITRYNVSIKMCAGVQKGSSKAKEEWTGRPQWRERWWISSSGEFRRPAERQAGGPGGRNTQHIHAGTETT